MALRFLRRHRQTKEQALPKPFLSSFTAGLTTTCITVKPSIIYHLPTKELTEGYQEIVNDGPPQQGPHQLQPVKLIQNKSPPHLASPEGSNGMQEQPVLLVVVRYVSSSIIHRLHTKSAGNSGNWTIT